MSEVMRCCDCPYAKFSQSVTGGTDYYHCRLDEDVVVSADSGPGECRAKLSALKHPLFAETVRIRREREAEAGEKCAKRRQRIEFLKQIIRDYGIDPVMDAETLAEALKEVGDESFSSGGEF